MAIGQNAYGRALGVKQNIHFFQRQALGLFDKEPGVQDKRPVEAAEHEKGLPAEVVDCRRRDLAQGEAEEPLGCGADGDAPFADSCGEDFAHVQPWDGTPGDVERHRFKKYHRQRRNRRRRQPPPIDARRIPLREHADDEHVGAHEERAREQRPAAADALDEEEQEKGAADDLADAEEAAEQEGVLAGADGLEDLGGDCGVSARISYPMG